MEEKAGALCRWVLDLQHAVEIATYSSSTQPLEWRVACRDAMVDDHPAVNDTQHDMGKR